MALFALWCFVLIAGGPAGAAGRTCSRSAAHPPDPWIAARRLPRASRPGVQGRGVGHRARAGLQDALSLDPLGTHAFVLGTTAFVFCEGRRHRSPVDGPLRLFGTFGFALVARVALPPADPAHGRCRRDGLGRRSASCRWPSGRRWWAAGLFPILDHFQRLRRPAGHDPVAFRRRLRRLFLLIVLALSAVWVRVLQLQVVEGDEWRARGSAEARARSS